MFYYFQTSLFVSGIFPFIQLGIMLFYLFVLRLLFSIIILQQIYSKL